ncbi:hypothetical protein YC2023_110092 [Brassica napus]
MKKTQVHVMVISLFIHLAASRVENVVVDAPAYIGKWAFMKTTVQISNRLGGGLTLVLHCKSKNNDLGIQTIAPDSSCQRDFTGSRSVDSESTIKKPQRIINLREGSLYPLRCPVSKTSINK